MHRLSILQHQQQLSQSHQQISLDSSINNEDRHWIDQIQNSTIHNPHGIDNHDALEELLNEVRYWTQPQQSQHHHNDDNVDNANENKTSSPQSYSSSSSSPLLSSGGSSSGAAATIAHGSSLLSIGTDTGGSLRLPAAWTNTVGFKPTYGTFSRYGVVSYASSLDTVGFVAGSVECARMVWECLSSSSSSSSGGGGGGCDDDKKEIESDNDNNHDDERKSCFDASKCRDVTARVYHDDRYGLALQQQHVNSSNNVDMKKPLANIRIGIPNAFSLYETPPLISNAWCAAANILQNDSGATLVAIPESLLSSEWIKLSCAAYYVLACAEASSNLSRYDGVRFGMDVNLSEFANLDSEQGYEAFHPLSGMTTLEEKISITRVLGFGYEVQRRVLTGTSVLSSDRFHTHYEAAAIARAKVSQSIERVFRSSSTIVEENDNVDVMLVPTAISFPCTLNPKLGDRIMEDMDPTAAFGNDVMTIPISLGGFPSISVPFSTHTYNDDGNYSARQEKDVVGLQVFGMRGSEDIVLQVAENIIMNTSF
jgi:aspartyl-tRNA(Asn)/glutamyl-tRNA(Gln) amidotransferase subunit A